MRTETVEACLVCSGRRIEIADVANALNRCIDCGFVFDSPRPTVEELVAFYSRPAQYDDWILAQEVRDKVWQRRVTQLRMHSRPGSLLDIGTGIGQFLHHATPYFERVTGTEVSSSAVEAARLRYGLDVIHGQVETLEMDEQFDNITMFHVLEHVPDPSRTVSRCIELLKPSGLLFVAVPNELDSLRQRVKRHLARVGVRRYARRGKLALPRIALDGSMDEIHLSHFTVSSLRFLLERHGLTIVHHGLDPYSVAQGKRALMNSLLYPVGQAVLRSTGRNVYDTIWMVARNGT